MKSNKLFTLLLIFTTLFSLYGIILETRTRMKQVTKCYYQNFSPYDSASKFNGPCAVDQVKLYLERTNTCEIGINS